MLLQRFKFENCVKIFREKTDDHCQGIKKFCHGLLYFFLALSGEFLVSIIFLCANATYNLAHQPPLERVMNHTKNKTRRFVKVYKNVIDASDMHLY